MRDITLKITGKQVYENHEEDQMEFVTEGQLYQRNGAIYMIYDESELSGMPYGPMDIEILTRYVNNDFNMETLSGNVAVCYDVSLQGMAEGKNKLEINVM